MLHINNVNSCFYFGRRVGFVSTVVLVLLGFVVFCFLGAGAFFNLTRNGLPSLSLSPSKSYARQSNAIR